MTRRVNLPLQAGDVLVKKRRVGIVLALNGMDVQVLTARGTETWAKTDCRRGDPANAVAVTYAVRALEAAKATEQAAVQALEHLRERDSAQRTRIEQVAHRQGNSHGLDHRLDDLLERNGLARRPTLMVRTLAVHVRYTYIGSTADRSATWPLDGDRYATLGSLSPHAIVDRVRVFSMNATQASFARYTDCTCEGEEDRPTPEQVVDQMRRSLPLPGTWTSEVVGYRLLYVAEQRTGESCRHYQNLAQINTWEQILPDAPPLIAGVREDAPV